MPVSESVTGIQVGPGRDRVERRLGSTVARPGPGPVERRLGSDSSGPGLGLRFRRSVTARPGRGRPAGGWSADSDRDSSQSAAAARDTVAGRGPAGLARPPAGSAGGAVWQVIRVRPAEHERSVLAAGGGARRLGRAGPGGARRACAPVRARAREGAHVRIGARARARARVRGRARARAPVVSVRVCERERACERTLARPRAHLTRAGRRRHARPGTFRATRAGTRGPGSGGAAAQ